MVGCRHSRLSASMGKNSENAFFIIVPLFFVRFAPNLVGMFFLMIFMQCSSKNSKFENFGAFYGGSRPPVSMGGVLYRTFAGMIGHDEKKDFLIFFFIIRGKEKAAHIRKNF